MVRALPSFTTVVVIGCGPAGIALGTDLRKRSVDFIVLERGGVAESWARMPQNLRLVSPWKCNWITAHTRRDYARHAQLSRAEYVRYLQTLAKAQRLPIHAGVEVHSVEPNAVGFRITTSRGLISATIVVNATGYFSNPLRPEIPGADTTLIPQRHYADLGNVSEAVTQARERSPNINGPILVVGSRLSAGQVALELFDAHHGLAISHKSPIHFGPNELLWPLVYRAFAPMETLRLMFGGGKRRASVPMDGGRIRRLIRSGDVPTYPEILRFNGDELEFTNGRRIQPSVVLYATGFRPAIRHLASLELAFDPATHAPLTREMESITVPNLFFLGLDMLCNFQSRFLRGIRNDAVKLAETIAGRAANASRKPMALCVA